jgi:ligand-binding sensor domain-containing protein
MKNLSFILFVFFNPLAEDLITEGLIPTHGVTPETEKYCRGQSYKSNQECDNPNEIQRDTLSNSEWLRMSAEYQGLDHSPINKVITYDGKKYTCSKKGINIHDGSFIYRITTDNANIPEDNITALAIEDDNLWIGTYTHGIVIGTGHTYKPYKTKIVLTHDLQIFSIVKGKHDGMWVTYRNGGYEYFLDGITFAYFPGNNHK